MDPPELASEPPRSRFGAALNSAPHLTPLGRLMLGRQSTDLFFIFWGDSDRQLLQTLDN